MAHGISINVGANKPAHDCCRRNELKGCEADALAMAEIARSREFEVVPALLGRRATWANLRKELEAASKRLTKGDILLLTFSGHGCQWPGGGERDGSDESWCLADKEVLDDLLHLEWARFADGVRILVVSDSCHSGDVIGFLGRLERMVAPFRKAVRWFGSRLGVLRNEDATGGAGIGDNCTLDETKPSIQSKVRIGASVLLLASCQDFELSDDGEPNGRFTTVLRHVWNGGRFQGDYEAFINEIRRLVSIGNPEQNPTCAWAGEFPRWHTQQPFTI